MNVHFGKLNPLNINLPEPSSADKYYTTLPPVYNYSHYSSIEKLYLQKAQNGSVMNERTPYMDQLTIKAPRGVKTDDHLFEYMKAEEADILLNLRRIDQTSQEAKSLKSKLEYVQEIISTFMQKKNPVVNLDLAHYGEIPFLADVEQVFKQEAREIYINKQKQIQKSMQYYEPQNKIVATDPYTPNEGFYLTFEFVNWIPYSFDKTYIKYGFSKRQNQLLAYRNSKEYFTESTPLSIYNNTCLFGHQDFVKGIKPDRDELLYFELWYTNKGEIPQVWRMFGWSSHELFDQMGVFMGGGFKVPLYDQIYERNLLNKIGLPTVSNGHLFLRLFLPIHFPSCYIIDNLEEHYVVPRYHMKNQDKSVIDSVWKKQQVADERIKQLTQKPLVEHTKHEGQVDEQNLLDSLSTSSGQDKLWGYQYNYSKTTKDEMIKRLTKQLNKHYLDSIVTPDQVTDGEFVYNVSNSLYQGGGMSSAFFQKSIDEQIQEVLPPNFPKQLQIKNLDQNFQSLNRKKDKKNSSTTIPNGLHFKITKISNYENSYSDILNVRGALIMNDQIIQDMSNRPCVVSKQSKLQKLVQSNYQMDFVQSFNTRNEEFLSEISYHNFQNAILLFNFFDDRGRMIGWLHAPMLKLITNKIVLSSGRYRVRLSKPPVLKPPLNYRNITYSNIVIEYQLLEGLEPVKQKLVEDMPLNINRYDSRGEFTEEDEEIKQNQSPVQKVKFNISNDKGEDNDNNGSTMINNSSNAMLNNNTQNESTMIHNVSYMNSEGNNQTIVEQLLNKSIFDNPTQLKPISIFVDGISGIHPHSLVVFKVSLLKDSVVCLDDAKAKIAFQGELMRSQKDGDLDFQEEIMVDIDIQRLIEKNKNSLDKYYIVINILDEKGQLLYWHYSPLFRRGEFLNIQDFQVRLYKPPFQVPSRVIKRKLVETNVIIKYGIGFTTSKEKLEQQDEEQDQDHFEDDSQKSQ